MKVMKDLFDKPADPLPVEREPHQLARPANPGTSKEAAAGVVTQLRQLQWRVLRYASTMRASGFTDEEMTEHIGDVARSTMRTRRAELTSADYIADSGLRRLLKTGRKAVVWRITHQGLLALASDPGVAP